MTENIWFTQSGPVPLTYPRDELTGPGTEPLSIRLARLAVVTAEAAASQSGDHGLWRYRSGNVISNIEQHCPK